MSENVFTVFNSHTGGAGFMNTNYGNWHGMSLQAAIDRCVIEFGYAPGAWAPEAPESYGGTKTVAELRAESIAAGRLIDCIDGKYIPRGIEDPELVALQTRPQHVEASCEEEKPASGLATLLRKEREKLEASGALERNRPPLPGYGQRTPFDSFGPDFIVTRSQPQPVQAKPFAGLSLDAPEQFRAPRSI